MEAGHCAVQTLFLLKPCAHEQAALERGRGSMSLLDTGRWDGDLASLADSVDHCACELASKQVWAVSFPVPHAC